MRSESADPPAADGGSPAAVPLGEVLPEGPPDPVEAIPLFLQILRSVRAYHQAGHPHAELAPNHIRIRQNGEIEIDPGNPRSLGPQPVAEAMYAAPEALSGQKTGLDRELQDIYSLGFLFYEVLLGTERFSAEFAAVLREPGDFQWLKWHGNPDFRARPLTEIRSDCPRPLSELIERMMEKRLDLRVSSLAEVTRVMEEVGRRLDAGLPLDDLVVSANPRNSPEGKGKPSKVRSRNWVLWTGAAAVLVVAMMLLGRSRDQAAPVKKAVAPPPVVSAGSAPQSIETPTGPMELILEQPAFYVDKYEVTNAAYLRFCDVTSRPRPNPPAWDRRYFDHLDHPVAGVSWQDARAFAEWAGKRLLSRSEWEKAAMGDHPREYPWGSWYEPGTANLRDSRRRSPAPVGWFAFDFSPFGVQDLAGNVAEWVGNESPAVRGGSFRSSPEEAKIRYSGAAPGPDVTGFRCAADVRVGIALRVVEPR